MAWQAKMRGGYPIDSKAWLENAEEIMAYFQTERHWYKNPYHYDSDGVLEYTDPKIVWHTPRDNLLGMIGNLYAESGLNPWRWQSDTVNTSGGYGLLQYTPSTKYTGWGGNEWDNAEPHPQTNATTGDPSGNALASDGRDQLSYFTVTKSWVSSAWRDYWDKDRYANLYAKRNAWLDQYSDGQTFTWRQFFDFGDTHEGVQLDIDAATFFFMACAEGPAVPNFEDRRAYSYEAREHISGKIPYWLLFKLGKGLQWYV